MGSQSVCLMSHGLSSDEGDMAPCGVLEGVSRGKLHPRLGGGAGGVVVVQRGERDVAADALSGNLSRARSSEEMVRGQREGQDVSNTLAREVMNGIPALSSLMVEGQASEAASD